MEYLRRVLGIKTEGSFSLTDCPITFWCAFATILFYRKQVMYNVSSCLVEHSL